MDHIDNALAMADAAATANDPARAQQAATRIARALRMHKEEADALSPIGGGTHLIVVPNISSIPNTGVETGPFRWDWPGGFGEVLGFFAGTVDGAIASLSAVSVRISIEGEREVVSDGGSPSWAPLICFRGGLTGDDVPWAKLRKFKVVSGTRWALYFKNVGGGALTPFFVLMYRATGAMQAAG